MQSTHARRGEGAGLGRQVDPAVSAAVHFAASVLHKAQSDYAKFYKASLQYLAFVSSDDLPHDFKLVPRLRRCPTTAVSSSQYTACTLQSWARLPSCMVAG